MIRSLWILIACGMLTSCVRSQAPEVAEKEVREASDRFHATRQRGDAAAHAGQFTEEGVLMVPGLADAAGRDAVRGLLEKRFAGARTTDFKVHRREIEVAGDSAYELAWYSEVHAGQDESMRLDGRYVLVWKRGSDGAWRVHRDLYNFSGMTPVKATAE